MSIACSPALMDFIEAEMESAMRILIKVSGNAALQCIRPRIGQTLAWPEYAKSGQRKWPDPGRQAGRRHPGATQKNLWLRRNDDAQRWPAFAKARSRTQPHLVGRSGQKQS